MLDWVWTHLWRVVALKILRNLTCGSSFYKVAGSETLNSMKLDSIREVYLKLEDEHYCLNITDEHYHYCQFFKVDKNRKPSLLFSQTYN